jgi:hypothetical protein
MIQPRSPRWGTLSNDRVRAALFYARKRRLARIAASAVASDPYIANVLFAMNSWDQFATAACPSGQTMTSVGTPVSDTSNTFNGQNTMLLDGSNSVWLDNTASSMSVANTTDFCFEAWFYCTGAGLTNGIFNKRDTASAEEITVHMAGADPGEIAFVTWLSGSVNTQVVNDTNQSYGQWIHGAFVRDASVDKMFINGVLQAATATETNTPSGNTQDMTIGDYVYNTSRRFRGNIGPTRITFGVPRYTTSFTPPQSFPLQ